MKSVQSYNKELKIATAQFRDAIDNVQIFRYNEADEAIKTIDVPVEEGNISIALKSFLNPKKNVKFPMVEFARSGLTVDRQRIFNLNNELTFTQDEEYTRNQPVPIDITFDVAIYSMYPSDDDQIVQNFAPFSMPNFYVSWKHPYTDETLNSQVVWSGESNTEYPVDFDTTKEPRIITTTTFIYKTWMFPGSALGDGGGRPETDSCDLIRKVITEWYDSADAYELLEEGIDIIHDDVEYNSYPKPYYANPRAYTPGHDKDVSVFGSNFKESMLVYLTSVDEILGAESPIIIDGVDSGLTGILTDYVFVSDEKFIIEDLGASSDTEVDIIIVSECGNYEILSDNQGHKIIIKTTVTMPAGDHYIALYNANGTFVLPLVDGEIYNFIVDWGDGSELERIESSFASHSYSSGTYTITLAGDVPRLSYELVPISAHTLLEVTNLGSTGLTTLNGMFSNCTNLTAVSGGVFSVTDMAGMFNRCFSLESFNYEEWDFSSITTMANFLSGVELDHTYYSTFLLWMYSTFAQTNFTFDGGNSQYNIAATVPRFRFEQDRNWTFTDGGFWGEMYQPEYDIIISDTTVRLPLKETNIYAFVINWGDDSTWTIIEDPNSIEIFHTYSEIGTYTIQIQGLMESWRDSIANISESFRILYHVYENLDLIIPLAPDGTYDFIIDWGDGSSNHVTEWNDLNLYHVYDLPNDYYVTITGICTKWLPVEILIAKPFEMRYSVIDSDLFVELPLVLGYNYDFDVDWGDGSSDVIDSWDDPDKLHEYPRTGDYLISITGLCEKLKVITEITSDVYVGNDGIITLTMSEPPSYYNYTIDWGDNSSSTITSWDDADRIHEYTEIGTYTLEIIGDLDDGVEISVVETYVFNVTVEVDDDIAMLVMTNVDDDDYTFEVDWGDNSSSTITSWIDADRFHAYSIAGDYTITAQGIIQDSLTVSMRGEIIIPVILGVLSFGEVHIKTGLIPSSGFEYELDLRTTESWYGDDVDEGTGHGIMGVEEYDVTEGQRTVELYRGRTSDLAFHSGWGSPRWNGTVVPLDYVRRVWSKDGLDISIGELTTQTMPNDTYDDDADIYLYARHDARYGARPKYFAKAIVYSFKCWSDENRNNSLMDLTPVVKGSIQYSVTPAPATGFWDVTNETYIMPDAGILHPIKEDLRTEYPAPDFGLASTSILYVDTGIHIKAGFDWELDFSYNHVGEPPHSGYGIMGNAIYNENPADDNDYVELIREKDGVFYSAYSKPVLTTDIGASDDTRRVIDKKDKVISITGGGSYTTDDLVVKGGKIYLYQRNQNDEDIPRYYADWTVYSFRVWCNADRSELLQELLPVPSGNTYYSTVPAPSNCFWDTVSEEYIEPIDGTLNIDGTVPSYML